jgi:putative SOS response-associated peptidase YedK
VPVDGFYEWERSGSKPQPHYFTRSDRQMLAFAGLWESWQDASQPDAPAVHSASIITTEANADMAAIHHRMPVILEATNFDRWLEDEPEAVDGLLVPAPEGTLHSHLVDGAVGNVRNDGPELIEPQAPSTLF